MGIIILDNGFLSCVDKNTDRVFIEEIQRMDPCAAHTSPTLQETREEHGVRRSQLEHLLTEVLAKEG